MAPDALVAEYRGNCMRPLVSDLWEKRYQQEGRDCYFFKVNWPPGARGTRDTNMHRNRTAALKVPTQQDHGADHLQLPLGLKMNSLWVLSPTVRHTHTHTPACS